MKKTIVAKLALALAVSMGAVCEAQSPKGLDPSTIKKVTNLPHGRLSTAKMTKFDPKKHGFEFVNDFQTELIVRDVRFGGLCGGMAYSSLDYFFGGVEAPNMTFRPAAQSPLFNHIYGRQERSTLENLDKWAELFVNPLGARNDEFFRWGLQGTNGGRLEELKNSIDAGKPCPLGLFKPGNGGAGPHHQVVAIGYDLGRYKGDLGPNQEDVKIFIYDPNFPNQTMTLVPDLGSKTFKYIQDPACVWMTYFVDRKYSPVAPLRIEASNPAKDSKVYELVCEFRTGGDDLRGGNDNLNVTVKFKNGTKELHSNVNRSGRWINNYTETVKIKLNKPMKLEEIDSIELQSTFGGGIGGDNWNLDQVRVIAAIGGAGELEVASQAGSPLVRFDGNNKPFKVSLSSSSR
jgi:hypothetical protein